MITFTPKALSVLTSVSTHPSRKPSSGVRVAARRDPEAPLAVRAVQEPEPGDLVVERAGGRLYLDRVAARRVDGGELDAVPDRHGRMQFIVRNDG
jgi:Fe-S cluster assembly iron-binding protein IscA